MKGQDYSRKILRLCIRFDTQRISVVGQLYLGEKVGRVRVVR